MLMTRSLVLHREPINFNMIRHPRYIYKYMYKYERESFDFVLYEMATKFHWIAIKFDFYAFFVAANIDIGFRSICQRKKNHTYPKLVLV